MLMETVSESKFDEHGFSQSGTEGAVPQAGRASERRLHLRALSLSQ